MSFYVTTVLVLLFSKCVNGADCPMMYRSVGTVCGTDGVTYPTLCELEVARIFDPVLDIAYFGKCTTYCKDTWEPVCGNDLVTYSNLCLLEIEARKHSALEVLHVGKCWSGDDKIDNEKKNQKPISEGHKQKKTNDKDNVNLTVTQRANRIAIEAKVTAHKPRIRSNRPSKKIKPSSKTKRPHKYKSYARTIEEQWQKLGFFSK